jgi:exosortase A-associated hydrolase 1
MCFPCEGRTLAATLDEGERDTGLLIVSGGTQTRIGAHRGFAQLGAAVAARGFPVFRFDRRGVGDSGGDDPGFAQSGPDITAAARAFAEQCPGLRRIVGFGLCDGATALALHHREAGIGALLLANPWVVEPLPGLPPAAAIRRRYMQRLGSRDGWSRLLRGSVDLKKAARGARAIAMPRRSSLAEQVAGALAGSEAAITLLLSEGDATAIAFEAEYRKPPLAKVPAACHRRATGSHSFAGKGDAEWLVAKVVDALKTCSV